MNQLKSKTIWATILLAGLSVVIENMETLRPYFGEYGPAAGVAVAVIFAMLRKVTTMPLNEK